MLKLIGQELKHHVPFTALGAATGIIIVLVIVFSHILPQVTLASHTVFYVLHPLHVGLSAAVTTAMYRKHGGIKLWATILIAYFASVGIGTLHDSIIPYLGERLLDMPNPGLHIGFLEEPQLVHPAAFVGIAIGYFRSATKLPHFGHVLVSTWAALFHIVMALGGTLNLATLAPIFAILFLSVWLLCCTSDIIFPLLFTKGKLRMEHD